MGWNWNIGNHNKDADFDGVKRKKDRCDNTDIDFLRKKCPNLKKKTDFVDKNGCEYDDDRDGIHNCYDQCPETPEGIEVDKNGCPINLNN